MASKAFFEAVVARRSYYQLSKSSPIPDAKIKEIVEASVKHAPSSFNSQTSRVLVLFGNEHEKLWDIVFDVVKAVSPPDVFERQTKAKLAGFKGAYGTAVLFEDREVVQGMQNKFALYAEKFPHWSDNTHGIVAYLIWTALELEGLGANLQHYDPLINEKLRSTWNIPESWEPRGQLVFGKPEGQPSQKTFQPIEERVRSAGSGSSA